MIAPNDADRVQCSAELKDSPTAAVASVCNDVQLTNLDGSGSGTDTDAEPPVFVPEKPKKTLHGYVKPGACGYQFHLAFGHPPANHLIHGACRQIGLWAEMIQLYSLA